jgi:hypothetical protein
MKTENPNHPSHNPKSKQPSKLNEVCHIVALPFTFKSIKARRRIMETQIFHHAKI